MKYKWNGNKTNFYKGATKEMFNSFYEKDLNIRIEIAALSGSNDMLDLLQNKSTFKISFLKKRC